MDNELSQNQIISIVLKCVAAVIAAVPIIRGMTGYYSSDLVWMLPMIVVAVVVYFIATRFDT